MNGSPSLRNRINTVVRDIRTQSEAVDETGRALAELTQTIADRSHQQSQASQSTASAMEEIATGISHVANSAHQAGVEAEATEDFIDDATASIQGMAKDIRAVNATIGEVKTRVSQLDVNAREIDRIAQATGASQAFLGVLRGRIEASEDPAVKVLLPQFSHDREVVVRFFNEAKASGRVRSPSIVEILDLGQAEDGSPFLVFELLEGEGLDEMLRREGIIAPELALELLVGVAKALEQAHAHGIIHRDLKPANLFITKSNAGTPIAKILDFGISKVFDTGHNFTLTRTGTVVGSPAYMSPEQAQGETDIDSRSDVWSLGVILYEALTGEHPFCDDNDPTLSRRAVLRGLRVPLDARRPDLPAAVCAL